MSPEAQQIAIARACGLSEIGFMDETLMHAGTGTFEEVPSYLTDLNACHEMEKVLTDDQRWTYADMLSLNYRDDRVDREMSFAIAIGSPAAQRCEAFLRTIGKWDDSKHTKLYLHPAPAPRRKVIAK